MEDFIKKFLKNFNDYEPVNQNDLKIIYELYHDNIMYDDAYQLSSGVLRYYAYYYEIQKDYENMKKYYLMAIEKGDIVAMTNFGSYYEDQEDYDNMEKYYLMAIEKDDANAMTAFGSYHKYRKDYGNMVKYYLMAANKGDTYAMFQSGMYYRKKKDYENII